jgi:asparagine synthase (glutamine-hydrolysing)
MCGITGFFAHNFLGQIHGIHLASANETLRHRGPDFGKIFTEDHVGLAHRRLSILDLSSAANQPFSIGNHTLVYNGEVFNFRQLRAELQAKGIQFETQSDTEVVLQLLIDQGIDAVKRLNGFFAFAYLNSESGELFLARDPMGIKPLYYYHDEDKFLFGSEIKAILEFGVAKEPDWEAWYQYFRFNYVPAPQTAFRSISKLLPGHYLKVSKKKVSLQQYYFPQTQTISVGYLEAKTKLTSLLEAAVESRLVSDVALGAFLSGGVDSSLVTALACRKSQKLNTFSIGYRDEPQYDESRYAALVAKQYKTEHTLFNVSQHEILDCCEAVLSHLGEPFADSSALPVYLLSKLTRQKVTVALSGDGADELFGGYHRYTGEWMARNMPLSAQILRAFAPLWSALPKSRKGKTANLLRRFDRFARLSKLNPKERYLFISSLLDKKQLDELFSDSFKSSLSAQTLQHTEHRYTAEIEGRDFNEILNADLQTLLPDDMLSKVDLMSMAHGLEVRPPFLDAEVVAYALRLPSEYKIKGKNKKIILQDIAKDLLPSEIFSRPKQGFDVPLYRAFQGVLRDKIEAYFRADFVKDQGIFNESYMQKLKRKVTHSTDYDQNHVWAIVVFQHWWKRYFA